VLAAHHLLDVAGDPLEQALRVGGLHAPSLLCGGLP
jgi:hypothetical protein